MFYDAGDGRSKLAAAWLIDQQGWKGRCENGAAVHDKQALVLVNKNHTTQRDILCLAQRIKESVYREYGVTLEIEPTVL